MNNASFLGLCLHFYRMRQIVRGSVTSLKGKVTHRCKREKDARCRANLIPGRHMMKRMSLIAALAALLLLSNFAIGQIHSNPT